MTAVNIDINYFQNALLRWYANNGRKLPWRKDYSPYHVWLSEIMLQQTQMERGVVYFNNWLVVFPNIKAIAEADISEILKLWEGLGYYARARNLHKAAKLMVEQFNGLVPDNYDDLLSLPGIGPYTASAISSIAFNKDVAVVDANVERVFARIFDIDRPLKSKGVHGEITDLANKLLPKGDARNFNQALMDLGGIVCTPKNPECGVCPVSALCLAYQGNFVADRPIKQQSKPLIEIEMATAILTEKNQIFIQQRLNDDIWGGLWEFPGGRLKDGESAHDAVIREYLEETGFLINIKQKITTVVHYYTKYRVILHCFHCTLAQQSKLPNLQAAQSYHWVEAKQLERYGFPAGHRKFIEYLHQHFPDILGGV